MPKWTIEYFNEKVEKAILKLPSGLLARYLHLTDLIEEFGPNLGMPHTRALGDKLFELRMKSKEGIGRVFYCSKIGKKIVVLHTFVKKSQRTPDKELKVARKRLKEVLENDA
ncbi:MAG: type II toxin-antitoxin system RelE/ParE family toxin [Planctomycetota bacterium]|jgi:phage-related protein